MNATTSPAVERRERTRSPLAAARALAYGRALTPVGDRREGAS
ncbi:hypothetical protein OHT61_03875 [Streptomyces sp. NBC_00178]|nr:hypothetical protein [Streptomyces sp. NBC_00178]